MLRERDDGGQASRPSGRRQCCKTLDRAAGGADRGQRAHSVQTRERAASSEQGRGAGQRSLVLTNKADGPTRRQQTVPEQSLRTHRNKGTSSQLRETGGSREGKLVHHNGENSPSPRQSQETSRLRTQSTHGPCGAVTQKTHSMEGQGVTRGGDGWDYQPVTQHRRLISLKKQHQDYPKQNTEKERLKNQREQSELGSNMGN